MPTKSWHLSKRNHNLDTSAYLYAGMTYLDWEVATLFYSAVHYVDAYLDTLGKHPFSHTSTDGVSGRNDMVRMNLFTSNEYLSLYKLSKAARYGWPKQLIQPADVKDAEDWYKAVATELTGLI